MHPMFQTDEILRLIVAHLAVPYGRPWPQGASHPPAVGASQGLHVYFGGPLGTLERKTLAKLARVCRAWEEVALDALWREIPTVEPLFGLFPPSCMSGAHRHESVQFTRPLVPSDWIRFRHYSCRVYRISLLDTRWTRWTVDFKAFLSLSHFHPGGPILPNLQHWSWDTHRGAGDIVGGMCFLSSSVTSVEVTLGHTTSPDTLFGFLYNLPMRSPHLQSLSLCYNDREWPDWGLEATMTALQSIFNHLPHLTRLCLPFFMDTPPFITRLGCIPGLRELVINCPDKLIGAFVDDDSDEGIDLIAGAPSTDTLFEDLTSVTLQSTMSSCFRFLRRFDSKNILNMFLTVLHLRSSSQLTECVQLVAVQCPHLRSFHIQYTPAQHDMSFDTSYFPLSILKVCSELEELSIGHPRVAPWTDEELLEAIRCWPRLRILRLNPRPSRAVSDSKLTLKTLWNLVKWCRVLEVVRFYVDTSIIPNLNELASANFEFSTIAPRNSMIDGLSGSSLLPTSIMATLGAASIKGSNVLSLVDFGISQRNEANTQELATFIATLCPTAQIQGSDIWKEVSVILKVNQATRLEDQRKIDTLRAEVERLMTLLNGQSATAITQRA
ncbi:hypothetical protein CPB86DRAFT_285825 [Serendipita vermifera]|nr:hypothetical protein CPB86DRAFT_285825 [Serendipita vermifera]